MLGDYELRPVFIFIFFFDGGRYLPRDAKPERLASRFPRGHKVTMEKGPAWLEVRRKALAGGVLLIARTLGRQMSNSFFLLESPTLVQKGQGPRAWKVT